MQKISAALLEEQASTIMHLVQQREDFLKSYKGSSFQQKFLDAGVIIGSHLLLYDSFSSSKHAIEQLITDLKFCNEDIPTGSLIASLQMGYAQGMFGRVKAANPGGIWSNLCLHPFTIDDHFGYYPLAAGVIVCDLLLSYGIDAEIKWVNDVLVKDKEVGGVFSRLTTYSGEPYLFIGTGIHVNDNVNPSMNPCIAMKDLLGKEISFDELFADFINFSKYYFGMVMSVQEHGNPHNHPLISEYKRLSRMYGREAIYKAFNSSSSIESRFFVELVDISNDGGLVLKLLEEGTLRNRLYQPGELITVHSGEIHYTEQP